MTLVLIARFGRYDMALSPNSVFRPQLTKLAAYRTGALPDGKLLHGEVDEASSTRVRFLANISSNPSSVQALSGIANTIRRRTVETSARARIYILDLVSW